MPYATSEEAVRTKLAAAAGVTALVAARIYPQMNTQEPVFPFVVFQRGGQIGNNRLTGSSRLCRYAIRVDVFAETEAAGAAVGLAILAAMVPSGGWVDKTNGVHGTFIDDSSADVTDDPLRVWSQTFGIWFQGA